MASLMKLYNHKNKINTIHIGLENINISQELDKRTFLIYKEINTIHLVSNYQENNTINDGSIVTNV